MNSGTDVPEAACSLARYLRDKPNASDMADGIRRWWLPDPDAVTEDELCEALTWMQQHGLIEGTKAADGRVRFRRIGDDALFDALLQSPACRGCGPATQA